MLGSYDMFLHSHSLFWLVSVVLFVLIAVFYRSGRAKPAKIMHMVLRVFYILLLITGIAMIIMNPYWATVVKGMLAFWLIFVMELIATRSGKGTLQGTQKTVFWIQFIVALVVVLIFGFVVTG
ncbi:YisL family protein [Alkalicoccus chagannorensis]|uniref:YisL family protein n=1 Tax=Alkalicoccus chagannorensis TaxID=427072 RepID=UPI00040C8ECF|nr:YisL family protein [Alkalicoccus chagannorensis]